MELQKWLKSFSEDAALIEDIEDLWIEFGVLD